MNQTLIRGLAPAESAFAFLSNQIEEAVQWQLKQHLRYQFLFKRLTTVILIALIALVINLPEQKTEAQETEPLAFASELQFNKDDPISLLVIEQPTVTIRPGKSLVQEQAEAAERARAAAAARASATAPTLSTEQAHQLVQEAAGRAGIADQWKILAALWTVESGKALYTCEVSSADGQAIGPLQFMPDTFRSYRADANGDGKTDICDARDALLAAANLLKSSGIADGHIDAAIHNYNHSMAYVHMVRAIADRIP